MTEHAPWHAGRTVGRTIYRGDGPDDLIGILDSRELAAQVVADHNAAPGLRAVVAAAQAVANGGLRGGEFHDAICALRDALDAAEAAP